MKVAYMLGSINRGGMETLLLDLFRSHESVPYEMICFYRKGGQYSEVFQNSAVPMIPLTPRFGFDPSYILTLRRALLKAKVDVVHAQQSLDLLYAKLATLGTGIKVIQTYHGYDFGANKTTKRLMQWAAKMSDLNIYVSEHQKNYYLKQYGLPDNTKEQVVYNGIDFSKLPIPQLKAISDPIRLGMVGNFVKGRNPMVVCQALALLHEKGVDFHFQFIGARSDTEPERYDDCIAFCERQGMSKQVDFLESRNDVPQLLASWDGFVYSTDHDTFGIAVIEAIASGLPTFVNDWEVMKEVTEDGNLAWLYPTRNAEALCKLLCRFITSPSDYQQKALKSAEKVREKFSIQQHANELYQQYQKQLEA